MIKRETFNKYQKLQELNIINSRLSSIEDGAFYDLQQLTKVNMSKNFISNLSEKIFSPRSKLWKFVVSHNTLSDIANFDINYLPELTILDISNNYLKYLPVSLINRLKNDNNFTLIASNNPWDCSDKRWSFLLNENLQQTFCGVTQFLPLRLPPQASFVTCVFWIFGSFWCGVIMGNLCMIKKIVFRNKTKQDQSTQYGDYTIFIT